MSYQYITIPNEVSINEIETNNYCLAPSKYSAFRPNTNVNFQTLDSLITESISKKRIVKNEKYFYSEIGSIEISTGEVDGIEYWGLELPSENPKITKQGDILLSTVRTYRGGIGFVGFNKKNSVCTPALTVIREVSPLITKEYLLSILRTPFFIEQILGFQNRGMYPRLDKSAMEHILIPVPKRKELIEYVSVLTKAYYEKIQLISNRHKEILEIIQTEIINNQKKNSFNFEFPSFNELENNRLDATYYSEKHKSLMFPTLNYKNGYLPLTEQGLELKPGPSLEIRLLGTRIDSDKHIDGFYRLITPKQILNNGTVKNYEYIGTPKKIPTIQYGDILFGESGTGRSMVYLDNDNNTINNAHAHILRPIKGKCSLNKAITVRCIMQYYKEIGIIDCITVGGSGGHLSPSYFDRVFIPTFPEEIQNKVAGLYHKPNFKYDVAKCTLTDFLDTDSKFNITAGIYELNKTASYLKEKLDFAIDNIVNDRPVKILF